MFVHGGACKYMPHTMFSLEIYITNRRQLVHDTATYNSMKSYLLFLLQYCLQILHVVITLTIGRHLRKLLLQRFLSTTITVASTPAFTLEIIYFNKNASIRWQDSAPPISGCLFWVYQVSLAIARQCIMKLYSRLIIYNWQIWVFKPHLVRLRGDVGL